MASKKFFIKDDLIIFQKCEPDIIVKIYNTFGRIKYLTSIFNGVFRPLFIVRINKVAAIFSIITILEIYTKERNLMGFN